MKDENLADTLNPDIGSEEGSSLTTWIIAGILLVGAVLGVPALINLIM